MSVYMCMCVFRIATLPGEPAKVREIGGLTLKERGFQKSGIFWEIEKILVFGCDLNVMFKAKSIFVCVFVFNLSLIYYPCM